MKNFEKDMAAFSFRQHQDVINYLDALETFGWTVEDAKQWVESKKVNPDVRIKLPRCPECKNNSLMLFPVNTVNGDQTGDDSKSVLMCKSCKYTEYSIKSIDYIMRGMIKKGTLKMEAKK